MSRLSILLLRVVPDQLLVSQSMRAWQGIWGKHAAYKWCPLIRKYSKMITFMCYMLYNNTYVRRGAWPNKLIIHMRKKAWPGSTLQLELYGKLLFYGMNGMWVHCTNMGSAQVVHSCKLCVVFVHYLGNCWEMNSISQSLETFAHWVHFTRGAQVVHFHCSCCDTCFKSPVVSRFERSENVAIHL